MTTVLYAHPYDKSFNHAVLSEVTAALEAQGKPFSVIDLYAVGFNPALEAASLRLYSRGETADPLARKYLTTLLGSNELIMVFPVWWGMMPAIVKGFFDKVMLAGEAYGYSDAGELIPAKISIGRTLMFTTSQNPTERFAPFFEDYFRRCVLDVVGMNNLEWHNCPLTSHGPEENRTRFLSLVRATV